MPLIPIVMHNVLDYLVGVVLLFAPHLLGLPAGLAAYTMQAVGGATIIVSLLTAYRFSIVRLVPFQIHLLLDVLLGVVLLLVAFASREQPGSWVPLLGAGIVYIAVPILSRRR